MSSAPRYLSTFTGIGGMDIGFDQAGWECAGMVEIDKYCMSILNRHWPEVPKHDDIRTARDWCDEQGITGNVELVIGGAPCQDLSRAGKQKGFDGGERSVLFFDMVALAAHVGARWLVYENVPGLLTSNEGRDFGAVLVALAEAGFTHVEWRMLDSQHFGVPQRRERVLLVACTADLGVGEVLTEPESLHWHPEARFTAQANPAGQATDGVGAGGGDEPGAGGGDEPGAGGADDVGGGQDTFRMLGFGHYLADEKASTIQSRDHKMATDLIVTPHD